MKAVVLCAGFGTRLGDLTRDVPKPMLRLHGQPLLAYLLGHLRSQGIRDVLVNLHFQPETIRDWFGDGSRWGLHITYSLEEQLLGTAGALKRMEPQLRNGEAFVVQYGDVLTDQELEPLVRHHRESGALATLLVHRRAGSNSVVTLDPACRVTGFLERPTDEARVGHDSPWVNSGICVCSPAILDAIPPGEVYDLPRDVFASLVPTGRLHAVPLSGYRCAIDSPARLEEARAALGQGRCLLQPVRREPATSAG